MNFRQSYKLAAIAGLLICCTAAWAQPVVTDGAQAGTGSNNEPVNPSWQPSLVRDGAYDRTPHTMRTLGWQPLREADILWKKRVWREIDTREKQNLAFRYPGDDQTGGGFFIEILLDAVKKGKIKAYSTFDDRFTTALSKEQIMEQLSGKTDTIPSEDPVTGAITMVYSKRDFDPEAVTKYRVKEDYMFDRNLGRMVVRIIGIAPMVDRKDPTTGLLRATSPLMWIYYPEARPVFAQYEVFNPENDVQRMTWDDFLEGRYWAGRIIQVSNANNESFKNAGLTELEALYESQRTIEQVFEKEHDMWVY
jgi:gliding motility associated protien GldN